MPISGLDIPKLVYNFNLPCYDVIMMLDEFVLN